MPTKNATYGKSLRQSLARAIRNAIRANRFARIDSREKPYFYSASGRFVRITRISDSHESPDSRESCESIRANHATKTAIAEKRKAYHHRKEIICVHGVSYTLDPEVTFPTSSGYTLHPPPTETKPNNGRLRRFAKMGTMVHENITQIIRR